MSTRPGHLDHETMRDAFRQLHGRRLHGFALLMTLGDRALAARLAGEAMAEASEHAAELRHPERAAAWLRARVVRSIPRRHEPPSPAEERAALDPLGVDAAVTDGLAALGTRERAALIAADLERLDWRDVETVTSLRGARLERTLTRARRRYLGASVVTPVGGGLADGPLVRRIRAVAARTMA
jgi:DNA-directed RNA polymerase specialized sigma24 family protein